MSARDTAGHTPGPWRVGVNPAIVAEAASDRWIAVCDEGFAVPKEQQHANARLIASAPNLLAERDRLRSVLEEQLAAQKRFDESVIGLEEAFDYYGSESVSARMARRFVDDRKSELQAATAASTAALASAPEGREQV